MDLTPPAGGYQLDAVATNASVVHRRRFGAGRHRRTATARDRRGQRGRADDHDPVGAGAHHRAGEMTAASAIRSVSAEVDRRSRSWRSSRIDLTASPVPISSPSSARSSVLSTAPLLETSLDGLTLARRGKVRDVYEHSANRPAHRRHRSHLRVRLRARLRHPDKGKVLTQLSASGSSASAIWCRIISLSLDVDAFPAAARPHADDAARPVDAGAQDRAGAGRVRGARVSVGIRLEGVPADRQRLRRDAAGRPARVRPAAGADFHARDQGRTGHDDNISEDEAGRLVGRELIARLKALTLEIYRARRRARGIEAASSSPTPSSSSAWSAPATRPTDVVLIDEVLTPDSSRFWPRDAYEPGHGAAELRQAVRARLSRRDPLEQAAAGPVAARRRGRRTREKYLDAFRRLSGRELQ